MFVVKIFERAISAFSSVAIFLFGVAAIALFAEIFREEGLSGVWNAITVDVSAVAIKFIWVLIIFFSITGSIDHLQKNNPEKFKAILSGKEGRVKMMALASLMPGPAGAKQLKSGYDDKSIEKTNILLCLVAMMALGVNIFIFRAKLLGGQLTLIWAVMALCLLVQVWLFCLFKPWKWFG